MTAILNRMDPHSLAEELPALYRAVLDQVAALEAEGRRAEAGAVRRDATRIYSRAWDDRARRHLEALLRRNGPASGAPAAGRRDRRRDTRSNPGSVVIP